MTEPAHALREAHLEMLRGQARLLAAAGYLLMGVALPATLAFVAIALTRANASPMLPIAVGAPPLMLGYLTCHFASRRLATARILQQR